MQNMDAPRVGVLTFRDPRDTDLTESRETYLRLQHEKLVSMLECSGVEVVDPLHGIEPEDHNTPFGIGSISQVKRGVAELALRDVQAVILGLWHWTEPFLPVLAVKLLNLPTLLYTTSSPAWAGATAQSAVGAALWEAAPNYNAVVHTRMQDDIPGLVQWIHGACAAQKLRGSCLLLWGGSYCLRMDHLRDDYALLKARFVGDIIEEDQYVLIKAAEEKLQNGDIRIEKFLEWLKASGAKVKYTAPRFTERVIRSQIALYLAARDRLRVAEEEYPIAGVSIKCQPEVSEVYGVTPCLLPSFLPYSEDSEGCQKIYPTVCEGDVKGLITAVLLHKIAPGQPPLFGDIKYVCDDYVLISNCGGSSVYYAGNSSRACEVMPRVTLRAQCQGASGGAVGYYGRSSEMTVARLTRVAGRYYMQLGVAQALEVTDELMSEIVWGRSWPHVALDIAVSAKEFMRIAGANHYCATPGNRSREVAVACEQLGIPVVNMNSEDSIAQALEELRDVARQP